MKKQLLPLSITFIIVLFIGIDAAFGQTCIADVDGTQTLTSLTWHSDDGGTCPPMSPYVGDVIINGPGNGDTLFINVSFEMTGTLTMNGLGNPIVCIEDGKTLTVHGEIICMHPNSTIDIRGTLIVDGKMELKNNCYFCGDGVAYFDDLLIKNNGSCDGIVELHAETCEAKNNDFCIDCFESPLAVELVSFSARELRDGIELSWQVESQENNAFYTVERNNGFSSWQDIHQVMSLTDTKQYRVIDAEPETGMNHYRLGQTDLDGSHEHLGIVSLNYKADGKMKISAYGCRLHVQSFEPMEIHEISVYDLRGYQHTSQLFYMGQGEQVQLDLTQLPFGIYIVKVEYPNGYLSKKIILADEKVPGVIF